MSVKFIAQFPFVVYLPTVKSAIAGLEGSIKALESVVDRGVDESIRLADVISNAQVELDAVEVEVARAVRIGNNIRALLEVQ